MKKLTFTDVARIYLITLGILSFWFMIKMAVAEPLCTGCSVSLVKWALPRAEILTFAWMVASAGTLWYYRQGLSAFFMRYLWFPRKVVATDHNQLDDQQIAD